MACTVIDSHTLRVTFIYVVTVAYLGDQLQVGNSVVMHELFIHDCDHNICFAPQSPIYVALTRCYVCRIFIVG